MKPGKGWACLDIETTIFTSYKRKANAFDERNWIVLMGWATKADPTPRSQRYTQTTQHKVGEQFIKLLGECSMLVGINLKFDLLHLLKDPAVLTEWMEWVAEGGNVWCGQLAEYLMDGQAQSSHMLSLDDMAGRYGCDTKVDEVKLLWAAGVPTDEIDPDLLNRYLIGEDLRDPRTGELTGRRREGDIGNTRDIFLKQIEKAKALGMSRAILVNMGSLLCTIEMERNGMYIDQPMGNKLAAELEVKLNAGKAQLEKYLPEGLPFEFSWTNRFHLSPMIFGGVVNYDVYEYDRAAGGVIEKPLYDALNKDASSSTPLLAYPLKDEVHYVLENGDTYSVTYYDLELNSGTPDLPERATFAGGKNAGECKTKKVKVPDTSKPPKGRTVKRKYVFPGFTQPDEAWASSTEGLYSVAGDVIELLGNRKDVPFLQALTSVVGMTKDLTTYFISDDPKGGEGAKKGMLTLVQPDSIIHHMLNHTSTVTGRFSSSNPNLQNIPKGNKSDVKQVFVSRFPDGAIVQSDFSSLEVYVQAILTSCRLLIEDLKSGIDLHVMRLSLKEHMDYQEVFNLCKGYTDVHGQKHKADDVWDYKRTGAKVFSFQRAYGAGAKTIAGATGMSVSEVEELIAAEVKRWPEIDAYFAKRTDEIKRNRKPTVITVPHPVNKAIMVQLGISRVRTPDGTLYTYRESPSMEYLLKRGVLASFSPTEIKNYEVQGTGGLWMKVAMWLMVRSWYACENFDGLSLLVNTVHDAAYADSDPSVKDESAALMHACMTGASDFIEHWFSWKLPLPVPSDTVWGPSMAVENKYDSAEFKAQSIRLREALRRSYMGGYTPSYINV